MPVYRLLLRMPVYRLLLLMPVYRLLPAAAAADTCAACALLLKTVLPVLPCSVQRRYPVHGHHPGQLVALPKYMHHTHLHPEPADRPQLR